MEGIKTSKKDDMVTNEDNNSCWSEIRFISIHRASFAKHIRSMIHSESEKQYEMIIVE